MPFGSVYGATASITSCCRRNSSERRPDDDARQAHVVEVEIVVAGGFQLPAGRPLLIQDAIDGGVNGVEVLGPDVPLQQRDVRMVRRIEREAGRIILAEPGVGRLRRGRSSSGRAGAARRSR